MLGDPGVGSYASPEEGTKITLIHLVTFCDYTSVCIF